MVTARLADQRLVHLGVLPDREKLTVVQFLREMPAWLQRTIHAVCLDRYPGYRNAVKEVLPTVVVVTDRFHVAQQYRAGADALRRKELKRLKQELPAVEYQQLRGSLRAFRKNQGDLTPEEATVLARLFAYSPPLKLAYTFREDLTTTFESNLSKEEAHVKLQEWQKRVQASDLTCYDGFLTTLDNWMDEITNYFAHRWNSGFVEGFNNKLKVLKRHCYGILNLDHLFQRVYLDLDGYRLFARRISYAPYM